MRIWVKIDWIKQELQEIIESENKYSIKEKHIDTLLSKLNDIKNEDQEWDMEMNSK